MSVPSWWWSTIGIGIIFVLAVVYGNSLPDSQATPSQSTTTFAYRSVTPTTTASVAPSVALVCPANASGSWDWYDAKFGFIKRPGSSPITKYAIAYGDGRVFTNSSTDQVFEHRYTSSGQYTVRVIVGDAAGRVGTASCQWNLQMNRYWGPSVGSYSNNPYLPYPGNGGGPTFCADGTISGSSGRGTCSYHGGIG